MCLYYSGGNIRGRHDIIQYASLQNDGITTRRVCDTWCVVRKTSTIHQDIRVTEHKNNIRKKEQSDYWAKVYKKSSFSPADYYISKDQKTQREIWHERVKKMIKLFLTCFSVQAWWTATNPLLHRKKTHTHNRSICYFKARQMNLLRLYSNESNNWVFKTWRRRR